MMAVNRTEIPSKGTLDKISAVIESFRSPSLEIKVSDNLSYEKQGKEVTFSFNELYTTTSIHPDFRNAVMIYYAKVFKDLWEDDLERLRREIDGVVSESLDEDGLGF